MNQELAFLMDEGCSKVLHQPSTPFAGNCETFAQIVRNLQISSLRKDSHNAIRWALQPTLTAPLLPEDVYGQVTSWNAIRSKND